jgi:hypothetical protein
MLHTPRRKETVLRELCKGLFKNSVILSEGEQVMGLTG